MIVASLDTQKGKTVTRKQKLARVNKVLVAEAAWRLAYLDHATFTTAALAKRLNMPCNRHFQGYMNSLGTSGLLIPARRLDSDGRWRKYWYAQETQPMFEAQGKEMVA